MALTEKQQRFVEEYLIDPNAAEAYKKAGYKGSPNVCAVEAHKLLRNPKIAAAIEEARKNREKRTRITSDRTLQELEDILTADANDLVEFRRSCCRFCWGKNHKYQYTPHEMECAKIAHEKAALEAEAKGNSYPPFDEKGGVGFNAKREPNPDCPECFGDGVGEAFFKDTRKLPPAVKALYAGVKVTKDGIEVKMHSKDNALNLMMRHQGLLNDSVKLKGDPENPVQVAARVVIVPPKDKAVVETKPIPKSEE